MVQDWPPREYPRAMPNWHGERYPADSASMMLTRGIPDDMRYPVHDHLESERRAPPMSTIEALRQHARIPVQHHFLTVIHDDGSVEYYGSSEIRASVHKFFNLKVYVRELEKANGQSIQYKEPLTQGDAKDHFHDQYAARRGSLRRSAHRIDVIGDESDEDTKGASLSASGKANTRKRPRKMLSRQHYQQGRRQSLRDDDKSISSRSNGRNRGSHQAAAVTPPPTQSAPLVIQTQRWALHIGDEAAVWAFYNSRFLLAQQLACKMIAKAWMRAFAPKKQSLHPYTGEDACAPPWWPLFWERDGKVGKVRHKEPDHLWKAERVHLLAHMLRMVVLPNEQQHKDIQKYNITVAKLEELAIEALSGFFNDTDKPKNGLRKPWIRDLFRVAKVEERYMRRDVDEHYQVQVLSNDKNQDGDLDDDDSDEEAEPENDQASVSSVMSSQRAAVASAAAAASTIHHHSQHPMMHSPTIGHSPSSGSIPGPPFFADLPFRDSPPGFAPGQAMMTSSIPEQMADGGMGNAFGPSSHTQVSHAHAHAHAHAHGQVQAHSHPHDAVRRHSVLFSSPPDFHSPTTPASAYPQTAWSQPSTLSPGNSTNQPVYAFGPTPTGPSPTSSGPGPAPVTFHGVPTLSAHPHPGQHSHVATAVNQYHHLGGGFDGLSRGYGPGAASAPTVIPTTAPGPLFRGNGIVYGDYSPTHHHDGRSMPEEKCD